MGVLDMLEEELKKKEKELGLNLDEKSRAGHEEWYDGISSAVPVR